MLYNDFQILSNKEGGIFFIGLSKPLGRVITLQKF